MLLFFLRNILYNKFLNMVKLHIKKGDQSQFLYETTVNENIGELTKKLTKIFNGRLKIDRLYYGR